MTSSLKPNASRPKKKLPSKQPSKQKNKQIFNRVLALDLARHCGWALVERTHKDNLQPHVVACETEDIGSHQTKRWTKLHHFVKRNISIHKPDLILIEMNFQYKNVRTTAMLNQLRGAVLLIAAQASIPVEFVDNNTAKKTIFGGTRYWDGTHYVGITKDMMVNAVRKTICTCAGVEVDSDAADAIALAYAYYNAKVLYDPLPRKPIIPKIKASKKSNQQIGKKIGKKTSKKA